MMFLVHTLPFAPKLVHSMHGPFLSSKISPGQKSLLLMASDMDIFACLKGHFMSSVVGGQHMQ